MRKVTLFIAMSLDGYIADTQNGINWLVGENPNYNDMITYSTFIKNVDTVIMGWNTYHQITTELSPDEWIYEDLQSFVITHKTPVNKDNIIFTNQNPSKLVKDLQTKSGKTIWICGGANIAQQLINDDLIDTYYLSVIPTILGSGIRLFDNLDKPLKLSLQTTQNYNGIVDLVYTRR